MTNEYKFHTDGTVPRNGEIFVFGSNLAVPSGKAARKAYDSFQARWGAGQGITGKCYAIPTKDAQIRTRSIRAVMNAIETFIDYAADNPNKQFWVTRVGCGLAGFDDSQIAPLFKGSTSNCSFPETWKQYLNGENDE